MPGRVYERLVDLAADQYGYFTARQATEAGVRADTVVHMARRGAIDRIARGLYRVPLVPISRWDQYMEGVLWPTPVQAVLSHETALSLYELSDVNPAKIHITVPHGFRTRRQPPRVYVLHYADLPPADVTGFEGMPITTPVRAIRDCHAVHLGPALIRQAIEDAHRTGWITERDAEALRQELLGDSPSKKAAVAGTSS